LARSKGTWSTTYDDIVELHWENNSYHWTVNLEKSTNIAVIHSTPGNMHFRALHALHEVTIDHNMSVCFNTQVDIDDEE
jgi:hypothetical protein